MSLTPDQVSIQGTVTLVSGSFSLFGSICLFVYLGYFKRGKRTFADNLILCIGLADFFSTISKIFGRLGPTSGEFRIFCQLQGFGQNFGDLASIFWTLILPFHFYLMLQRIIKSSKQEAEAAANDDDDAKRKSTASSVNSAAQAKNAPLPARTLLRYYHLGIWSAAYLFSIIPLFVYRETTGIPIGDSGLWCWITRDFFDLQMVLFFIPLWLSFSLVIAISSFSVYRWRRDRRLALEAAQREAEERLAATGTMNKNRTSTVMDTNNSNFAPSPLMVKENRPLSVLAAHNNALKSGKTRASGLSYYQNFVSPGDDSAAGPTTDYASTDRTSVASAGSKVLAWENAYEQDANAEQEDPSQMLAFTYYSIVALTFLSFFITWTPGTINRMVLFLNGNVPVFALSIWQSCVSPGRGFTNFMLFIVLRGYLKRRFSKSDSVVAFGENGGEILSAFEEEEEEDGQDGKSQGGKRDTQFSAFSIDQGSIEINGQDRNSNFGLVQSLSIPEKESDSNNNNERPNSDIISEGRNSQLTAASGLLYNSQSQQQNHGFETYNSSHTSAHAAAAAAATSYGPNTINSNFPYNAGLSYYESNTQNNGNYEEDTLGRDPMRMTTYSVIPKSIAGAPNRDSWASVEKDEDLR